MENNTFNNPTTFIAFTTAFLLLIPTYVFTPDYTALFLPLVGLIFYAKVWKQKFGELLQQPFSKTHIIWVWFPLFIMVLSLVNKYIINTETDFKNIRFYSSFFLFPFVLIASRLLQSNKVLKWVIYLVIIEIVISIAEYLCNVRSFFLPMDSTNIIINKYLLYDSRVFGLSGNSPIFGLKILIVAFFIPSAIKSSRVRLVFHSILFIGLVINFNRAVIVALLSFWAVSLIIELWHNRKSLNQMFRSDLIQFYLTILITLLVFKNYTINQFSKGSTATESFSYGEKIKNYKLKDYDSIFNQMDLSLDESDAYILKQDDELNQTGFVSSTLVKATKGAQTSGRKMIWLNFTSFIDEHLWWGNNCEKVMFKTYDQIKNKVVTMHAHNSFLEHIATNGLIIFCLYILFYILIFKKKNVLILLTIIIYSCFQYGIFWGFSMLDALFVMLLASTVNYTCRWKLEN